MMLKSEKRVKFHAVLEVEDSICFSLVFGLWFWYLLLSMNEKGKTN